MQVDGTDLQSEGLDPLTKDKAEIRAEGMTGLVFKHR